MDPIILVLIALFVILVIAIIIGSYRHVHKSAFKPEFVELSDGRIQMEFKDFGGMQTKRTERFYEKYKIGMQVTYKNVNYKIVQLKEVNDSTIIRLNSKMVAYLERV